jgi:hypothetical protein
MNDWQGKPKYWEKTFPSSALVTTVPMHDLVRSRTCPSVALVDVTVMMYERIHCDFLNMD